MCLCVFCSIEVRGGLGTTKNYSISLPVSGLIIGLCVWCVCVYVCVCVRCQTSKCRCDVMVDPQVKFGIA